MTNLSGRISRRLYPARKLRRRFCEDHKDMSKVVSVGAVVGLLCMASTAHAVSTTGCGHTSQLVSRNAAGTSVWASSVFPDSGTVPSSQVPTFIATAPDGAIVLLIPSGSDWEQRPLYFPTPNDP